MSGQAQDQIDQERLQILHDQAKQIPVKLSEDIAAGNYSYLRALLSDMFAYSLDGNVIENVALNAPKEMVKLQAALFLGLEKIKSTISEERYNEYRKKAAETFAENLSKVVRADKNIAYTLSLSLRRVAQEDTSLQFVIVDGASHDASSFFQASPRDALAFAEGLLDITKDRAGVYPNRSVEKIILDNIGYINDGLEHSLPGIIDTMLKNNETPNYLTGPEDQRLAIATDTEKRRFCGQESAKRENEVRLIARIIQVLPKIAKNNEAIATQIAERVMRSITHGRAGLAGLYKLEVIKTLPDVLVANNETLSKSLLSSLFNFAADPKGNTDITPENDPALPAISKPVAVSADARVALVFDIAANTTLVTVNGRVITEEDCARNKYLRMPVVDLAEKCAQSHPAIVRMAADLKRTLALKV